MAFGLRSMAFLRQRELGSCSDMPLASRPLMLDMQVIVRLLVLEVQRLDYADVLGCSSGTFVDTPTSRGIHKKFTCESGTRTGTFTAEFFPPGGPWKIVNAIDGFSGLSGWGAVALTQPADGTTGAETFIGEIQAGR